MGRLFPPFRLLPKGKATSPDRGGFFGCFIEKCNYFLLYNNYKYKINIDIFEKGHYNLILQGNFERRENQR